MWDRFKELAKLFWPFMQPHRRLLILALIMIPIATLMQLAGPLVLKFAIDEHLMKGNVGALGFDVLLFGAFLIGEFIFRAQERYYMSKAGLLTLQNVRKKMVDHISKQPVSEFEYKPIGAIVSRVTNDVEALMDSLSIGAITLIADAMSLIGILIIMSTIHFKLTLMTFMITIPLFFIINFYRKRLRNYHGRIRKHTGKMNGIINESILGVRELQLFGYEKAMQKDFAQANDSYHKDNMRVVSYDATLYSLVDGTGICTIAVMAWYGSSLALEGAVTIGALVAFIAYIQRFFMPLKEFSTKLATLQGGFAAIDRIADVLETDNQLTWGETKPKEFNAAVDFKDVWFSYGEKDVYALRGLDLSIEKGERVALVGATGSGKSSVVKVLTGQYPIQKGEVIVDGIPVFEYDQDVFQHHVGIVHQDVHIWSDTVSFNVGLGNPNISQEAIEEACRIVKAHDFIIKLPEGYQTVLPEGGRSLSQGQKQLIAFARVLAWSPDLVILDEATSSVDSQSEKLIQQAILEIFKRKTTLVIAHRLSTIAGADRILVVCHGKIVETGTHRELLAQEGYYAKLFEYLSEKKVLSL